MASPAIDVDGLSKTYQVPEREGGFKAAVRGFFRRKYNNVQAVQQVTFRIEPGEVVGFLGPNGAGKTTTLKMLAGLLHPTAGKANVLGFTPWERKNEYLQAMTLVMGQRSRLTWDIPAADSFLLNQAIYRIPDEEYRASLKVLDELLELAPIMRKPVRNLSLGERMKVELAAGLLHRPKVLFLDEPTIGLDITAQARIREFLSEYNHRTGSTILLTSHYMADVTALCERIIIIHHGQLRYDGGIAELSRRIAPFKLIGVALGDPCPCDLSPYGTEIKSHANGANGNGGGGEWEGGWEGGGAESAAEGGKQYIQVPAGEVAAITSRMLRELPIHDLTIEDPPIEDVIERAFNE